MQWIEVESSQISHIGYQPDVEYPLGVKFMPTKKQLAAGQPGSIYEYAGVTPELFQAFLGAKDNPEYENSVGKFFGTVIKAHPELYPYRKTEQVVDLGPVTSASDEL